jgi:hypothetical protein
METEESKWHKIFFNSNNIKAETNSGIMILMPNKSQYIGYVFWISKKLVRYQGGRGYFYTFSFRDDFVFKLKKYGQGIYNKLDVIREFSIGADEMLDAFGVTNENVNFGVECETDHLYKESIEETVIEKHMPKIINPVSSNVINELQK